MVLEEGRKQLGIRDLCSKTSIEPEFCLYPQNLDRVDPGAFLDSLENHRLGVFIRQIGNLRMGAVCRLSEAQDLDWS